LCQEEYIHVRHTLDTLTFQNLCQEEYIHVRHTLDTLTFQNLCQEDSLYQSQINKLDLILDKMDLKPEHHIFEIGCGWGGFACRAVERFGCKVIGMCVCVP